MTSLQAGVTLALVLLLAGIVIFLVRYQDATGLQSPGERSMQRLHLVQTMGRDLLASAEAEKSAVMADTDEASQAFAEQSIQAAHNVEKARRELEPLLDNSQQVRLFRTFSRCWEQLQTLDQEILSLAVQNTNLKALRLSFGPADAVPILRLATQALTRALTLYTLQAPHIAESTATRMEEMEASMHSLDAQVTEALQRLQALVDEPGQTFLAAAWAAYKELHTINADIVALSCQNSNIRLFASSLGQKRKLTAQCQEGLAALQEAIPVKSRNYVR